MASSLPSTNERHVPYQANASGKNQVQTLKSDTATITFTGALQDGDSEDSSEPENEILPTFKSGDGNTHALSEAVSKIPNDDVIPPDMLRDEENTAARQTQISKETTDGECTKQRRPSEPKSPVRFNPFDRDDCRDDIRNIFPQLTSSVSVTPAQTVSVAKGREGLLTSVSSDGYIDGCIDLVNSLGTSPALSERDLGLEEDHFAQPDEFDYTSPEDLQLAIEECKQKVLESQELSETRRQLVQKLVQLRLKLAEAEEEPQDGSADTKHIVGHHFQKKEGGNGRRYCEKCNGIIWVMLQNWYRCEGCGFCSHTKCLDLITRTCAQVKVAANPHYITSICPERGLAFQNYRCLECRAPISYQNGYGEPRQCDYTGAYYCELCHWNDAMVIPARILHNWDFEPRKVCRASKQFLRLMSMRSVLRLQDLNPMLFNFVEELNEVKKLREEILIMKKYFTSCKAALDSKLLLQLQNRQHFVENSDMYSLYDLEDVASDVLLPQLAKIHASFAQHIKTDCQLCKGKGFICELCDYQEVLFPFDNHAIVCPQCSTVLHRHCYMRKKQRCPKCERIERRGIPDLGELVELSVPLQT